MLLPSPPPNGPPPPGLVRSSAPGCENQPGALFFIRPEASAAGRKRPAKPLSVGEMRTTRGRAWLAIAVTTLMMIGILYGEIWTLERGFSSTTACYVALSNDLVSLMSLDEMDFAATDPTCGH
jgi:hypothetical protein